ncbi:MAG TPA: hypothetical protein VF730_02490 [Terracidiphilus sp.]
MLEGSDSPATAPVSKRMVLPFVAAVVIGIGGLAYAVYEHHSAQSLSSQNKQVTAQLNATQGQLSATNGELNVLAAKVNALEAKDVKPTPDAYAPGYGLHKRTVARRPRVNPYDARFKKMQSQLDAQGQEIDQTRSDLASAQTTLGSGIAKNHDELVAMERKGESNFFEFDIAKDKEYKREGPLSVRLRKANVKHQYADLYLIVDDRDLQQKHVNLDQPVMFYTPDSPKPVEIVINSITKNHIHGYVSAPKYKTSELNAMANGQSGATTTVATTNQNGDPTLKSRVAATTAKPDAGVPEE